MNVNGHRRVPWIHHLVSSNNSPFSLYSVDYFLFLYGCTMFLLTPSSSLCNCSVFYSSKHHSMTWAPLSQFLRTSTRMFVYGCLLTCPHSDSLTEWLTRISSTFRYLRFRKIKFRDVSGHLWSVHPVRKLHRNLPLENFADNLCITFLWENVISKKQGWP